MDAGVATADLLRLVACGDVDDGKSTLLGRLMFDCGALPDDQIAQLVRDSRNRTIGFEGIDVSLAFDELIAEREQNITIDVAHRYFGTPRRRFILADASGHEQFTRKMVTAASRADLALILVDARRGLVRETRRHAAIAGLMEIRQSVLAVTKMDLVGFEEAVFAAIAQAFAAEAPRLGFTAVTALPVSGLTRDNVVRPSARMAWYRGPTLLAALEAAEAAAPSRSRLPTWRRPAEASRLLVEPLTAPPRVDGVLGFVFIQ